MIQAKRNQLQQFLTEQTLGPGISKYRFINLNDSKLLDTNFLNEKAIDYANELINIVPAGVYSTGILFPNDKSKDDDLKISLSDREQAVDDNGNPVNSNENDETSNEDESVQIDQMYPNKMGFSCCFSRDVRNSKELFLIVQSRYYIKNKDDENEEYITPAVLCEMNYELFNTIVVRAHLHEIIQINKRGPNSVLTISKLNGKEITEVQNSLKNFYLSELNLIYDKLVAFKFRFKVLSLSGLKQSCYYELKNHIKSDEEKIKLIEAIQAIEILENFNSHVEDLISINGEGYGLWRSQIIDISIPIVEYFKDDFEGKKVISYEINNELKNVFHFELGDEHASLSLNLQLSKDSRGRNSDIFFKAQLVNSSSPFIKKPEDSRYYSPFNELVNQRCFFGVKMIITHENLVSYSNVDLSTVKTAYNEDDVTKFVYRQFQDYGIGHGCSVNWSIENGKTKVQTEYLPSCDTPDIDSVPRDKVTLMKINGVYEPAPFIKSTRALEFKWLSEFSTIENDAIISSLEEFVESYQTWINNKLERYSNEETTIKRIALLELDKCQLDKNRMSSNIRDFFSGDKNKVNLKSFRVMNSAMFMQLWHSVKTKTDEITKVVSDENFRVFDFEFYKAADDRLFDKDNSATWRPFQLAFILLNLDGIFKKEEDVSWKMRNEFVDLVWFPTGGGKTEAYLGIIALTIIDRRLKYGEKGGGTAAIMRYTLRLLTLQQFQRATLVIMALELMRRWDNRFLGKEPIFIGLWVGDNSLPNKMSSTDETDKNTLVYEFRKLSQGHKTKIPYDRCPWCKSELNPSTEVVGKADDFFNYNRLHLRCSNKKCSFYYSRPGRERSDQGPIPVSLCDEEIYQHPPALLFGTVDKFAQLAHKVTDSTKARNKDSRRIFGKGNWEEGKPKSGYLTPDLIIQDELHLLLGPLGSSVALFECAIDQLCTRSDGTRPKIISSTATTRNTDLQIMALFDRRVNLFPKPGVECDDNFFSFYKRQYVNKNADGETFLSKRKYIGILPTGKTQIWMQMRLAAILLTHRAIFEIQELGSNSSVDFEAYRAFEKAMDYYHTVVSYFNSLKEVGKTESQIHTYILKEIRRVFNRVIRPTHLSHAFNTYSIKSAELTGRLSGEEVKNELQKVQSKWKADFRFAHVVDDEAKSGTAPPDFVVATNMISVGIDVSRFNSIIINSMPRNIAEYIQASSRVARDSFGLVLTVHHPFRARDISHYERFIEFHEKMYSYVEPISITPFTKKAVERYLGLYLATMIRHTTEFNDRNSAINIRTQKPEQLLKLIASVSDYFNKRRISLEANEVEISLKNLLRVSNVSMIEKWIREAIYEWKELADKTFDQNKTLVFKDKKKINPPGQDQEQLYIDIEEYEGNIESDKWQVPMSLRVVEPEASLKIKLK